VFRFLLTSLLALDAMRGGLRHLRIFPPLSLVTSIRKVFHDFFAELVGREVSLSFFFFFFSFFPSFRGDRGGAG